jgi:hypothetical protein
MYQIAVKEQVNGGDLLALEIFMFEAPDGGEWINFFNKKLDTSHSSPVDGFWNVRFHVVSFSCFPFLGLDPLPLPMGMAAQRKHPKSLRPIACCGLARGQSTR